MFERSIKGSIKDSTKVALIAQWRMLAGASHLLGVAIVPMLVMMVPVLLVLGQLSLWYQYRPLRVGEVAVVTLKRRGVSDSLGDVKLNPPSSVELMAGPVRIFSKNEVCWKIKALAPGSDLLEFQLGEQIATKDLAIGDGFMRTGKRRPVWQWSNVLFNPSEEPFPPGSPIESIETDYPPRDSWTSGTNSWIIYWFAVSMIAAFSFRRALHVNL